MRNCTKAIAFAATVTALPVVARAQTQTTSDPQSRPVMLSEGAGITDVVDAADLGSIWAFRFTAGYYRSTRSATLQRERSTLSNAAGAPTSMPGNASMSTLGTTEFDNIAHYSGVTQTLNLGLELAVYHDFSLTVGVPIILSQTSGFSTLSDDGTGAAANQRLADGYSVNGMPSYLFRVPFQSPERSGIDQLRFGFMWNILNQARNPHVPTWLVRFEYRLPIGTPMRPCSVDTTTNMTSCPQSLYDQQAPVPGGNPRPNNFDPPGSNNVDTTHGGPMFARTQTAGASPGISRGVHGFYLQTIAARNLGYLEPYIGLDFLLEIPNGASQDFRFGDTPFGQLSTYPPIQGSLMAGAEITPWQNRETWQRFVIDLRLSAKYYSQGRDYTPLYDALGTSNSIPLTAPSYTITALGQTPADRSHPVFFTGTTDVHSSASITGQIGISIQPARFLRFAFGGAVTYMTPHLMTATDACNPRAMRANEGSAGGCPPPPDTSVPDPQYRSVIDAPGQRFRFVDDITWDIWINLFLTPRF